MVQDPFGRGRVRRDSRSATRCAPRRPHQLRLGYRVFTGWAEAICHGHFTQTVDRKYNAAWIYKRAEGEGVIHKIEGLAPLMAELGEHVMLLDLLPIGAPRRNWKQTLVSDGMIIVRHPDLERTLEIADRFATELRMYASLFHSENARRTSSARIAIPLRTTSSSCE